MNAIVILRNLIIVLFLTSLMAGCIREADKAATDATNDMHQALESANKSAKSTEDAANATTQAADDAISNAESKLNESDAGEKK